MNVIGLSGVAGSGKSTVANYLVEQHGFVRLSFAAPLKKMLRTLNPVLTDTPPDRYSPPSTIPLDRALALFAGDEGKLKASSWGEEYRRLLQVLGTDCIRAVDENFWVNAAIKQMTDPDGKYVFDDVRFPNEADVIKGYNPLALWNIDRAGYSAVNGHSSEAHAGNMGEKVWLLNDGELEFLYTTVDDALDVAFEGVTA